MRAGAPLRENARQVVDYRRTDKRCYALPELVADAALAGKKQNKSMPL
jgi:hypothetical protein